MNIRQRLEVSFGVSFALCLAIAIYWTWQWRETSIVPTSVFFYDGSFVKVWRGWDVLIGFVYGFVLAFSYTEPAGSRRTRHFSFGHLVIWGVIGCAVGIMLGGEFEDVVLGGIGTMGIVAVILTLSSIGAIFLLAATITEHTGTVCALAGIVFAFSLRFGAVIGLATTFFLYGIVAAFYAYIACFNRSDKRLRMFG